MIAMKVKVTFQRFTLDFYFPLHAWGLISILLIATLQSYQ